MSIDLLIKVISKEVRIQKSTQELIAKYKKMFIAVIQPLVFTTLVCVLISVGYAR